MKIPKLYHGTCPESAVKLLNGGFDPKICPSPGGNCGREGLLYVTNVPDNARWFANEKGCNDVLELRDVGEGDLIVDPEDGTHDTVEAELAASEKSGLPAYLAVKSRVPPGKFARLGMA